MIQKFNLDDVGMRGGTILPFGDAAVGKTHLIGDMLKVEQAAGPVQYINILGEDGMLTISKLGLGNVGVTIDTYEDFMALIKEKTAKPDQAWGIDSFQMLQRLASKKITGSDRLPKIPSSDEMKSGAINEWPEIHRLVEDAARKAKYAARFVMFACSIDKTVDNLDLSGRPKAKYIGPNLPGKEATECQYWFDFIGQLTCTAVGPGKYLRTFDMVKDNIKLVRQRLPQMIVKPIILPEGQGGWLTIKNEIIAHGGFNAN